MFNKVDTFFLSYIGNLEVDFLFNLCWRSMLLWFHRCPSLLSFCVVIINVWLPSSRCKVATAAPDIKSSFQAERRKRKKKEEPTELAPFLKPHLELTDSLTLSSGESGKVVLYPYTLIITHKIRLLLSRKKGQWVGSRQLLASVTQHFWQCALTNNPLIKNNFYAIECLELNPI